MSQLSKVGVRDLFIDAILGLCSESSDAWTTALRKKGEVQAQGKALPTTRDEEWRFTPLGPLLEVNYDVAPNPTLSESSLAPYIFDGVAARLVFINGRLNKDLSYLPELSEGVHVGPLAELKGEFGENLRGIVGTIAAPEDNVFTALNQAHLRPEDTPVINVDKDVSVELPIHLLFVSTSVVAESGASFVTFPRVLVRALSGGNVTVVEDHISLFEPSSYFVGSVIEASVAENATVSHIKVLRDHADACHIARSAAKVAQHGQYKSVTASLGGRLTRHDIQAIQEGDATHCELHGLAFLTDQQLSDTHSCMDHAKPHGTSDQIHKVVVGGRARAVFNGKIFVRQDAQKTAAEQLSRSLLLSERALVYTKPQLEIFADDVRCTHGATIGQIEGEELFYLQSRGVDPQTARQTLTFAFAGEVLEKIPVKPLKDALRLEILSKLSEL